jgi:NTP pyrophosphatase (non-canonical NTP hydrolase)
MKKYEDLEVKVLEWAKDKGILDKATPVAQADKTLEEVNELIEAIFWQSKDCQTYKNNKGTTCNTKEEIQDAFGDILVTIIIGAKLQGLNLIECLESAYNVILKRNGKMINGKFEKDGK